MLWLWRRTVATAPIGPLAWEPPYAMGVAQRNSKKTGKKKKRRDKEAVSVLYIHRHLSLSDREVHTPWPPELASGGHAFNYAV